MVSPEIPDKERIYRAILLKWWNFDRCKISPAAFIDANGVSVDRIADRSENDVLESLKFRFRKKKLKAVCSLTAGECRELNTFVFYSKSSNNIYHSTIWNSKTEVLIPLPKAYDLAEKVRRDFINENLNT